MHELQQLESGLTAGLARFSLREFERCWDDNAFGSGYVVLGRLTPELRLVWDGKDGWAWLQRSESNNKWVDIAGPIAEGDFLGGKPDDAKLQQMVAAAVAALE